MSNALAFIVIKVAMFWFDAHVAAMKMEVISKLEYKTGLSGRKPLSSENRCVDYTNTVTATVGIVDHYESI